jgi:predicted TPR repeat methyltransferase
LPRRNSELDEQSTNGDSAHQQSLSCYDVLLVGDLELALDIDTDDDNDSNRYALIFACDVFCYIGNLKQIFQRVYNALTKHGGIFAFSVESLQPVQQQISQPTGTLNMVPFQLHECARFAHSQDYLNDLASDCGFTILTTQTCPIRKNQGENVMGLLYVLEKDVRGS